MNTPESQSLPPAESPDGGKAEPWELTELKPKHKQVCSLLAQGLDRETIARVVGYTPEYISMLGRQPLIQDYIKEMAQIADLQLEAMYTRSVTAIGETLENGSYKEKMTAARLQLEATKRIGSRAEAEVKPVNMEERLLALAERLASLQAPGDGAKLVGGG